LPHSGSRKFIWSAIQGAAIAMRLAYTCGDLVSPLVLISAAGVEVSRTRLREQVERTGTNPMIEAQPASDYKNMMRIGMSKQPYVPSIVVSAPTGAFVGRAAINKQIASDIDKDLDQAGALRRIAVPSLTIWGRDDKVMHVHNADFLHQRLPRSEKLVLQSIDHVPMVEAPRQVAAACSAFLAVERPHVERRDGACFRRPTDLPGRSFLFVHPRKGSPKQLWHPGHGVPSRRPACSLHFRGHHAVGQRHALCTGTAV